MVTCQVANERNVQRDVSYFKTSSPGESTQQIVARRAGADQGPAVLPGDATRSRSRSASYFEALASATRQARDRGARPVRRCRARRQVQGDQGRRRSCSSGARATRRSPQTIEVDTDIEKARKGASKLRNLDREVNALLMKLVREKRKAYVMTGHGEINDPDSVPPELKGRVPERRTTVFKKRLGELNYEVKDLGLIDLAKDVPDDATIVIMLAPSVPLQPAEWAALERYLDKGGRLLIALDPKAEPASASSRASSALKFNPGDADRRQGVPAAARDAGRSPVRDHHAVLGARVDDRAVALGRQGPRPDRRRRARGRRRSRSKGEQPKKTITIRSMESSFLDLNDNFTFDAGDREAAALEHRRRGRGPEAQGRRRQGQGRLPRARVRRRRPVRRCARVERDGPRGGRAGVGPAARRLDPWLGGEEVFVGRGRLRGRQADQAHQEPGRGVVHADDRRRAAARPHARPGRDVGPPPSQQEEDAR